MEEKDVIITLATDWTPLQAQKAFDDQTAVSVNLAGESRSFIVAGFRRFDDDIKTELFLRGTLPLDIGEPPEVEQQTTSSI